MHKTSNLEGKRNSEEEGDEEEERNKDELITKGLRE